MKNRNNIGLFFGTFNPIHVGHLIIAQYLVQQEGIDRIWFVISPQNPLKQKSSLLADYHRYRLVIEAIEDNPLFQASDIEFDLPQPSYTIDTLAHLSEKYPGKDFSVIMGEANLRTLPKWKNYRQIIENYRILVYPRVSTGYDRRAQTDPDLIRNLTGHPNITLYKEVPVMAISASFIRRQIREGKSVRYLLTPPVAKYIEEMHFYEK